MYLNTDQILAGALWFDMTRIAPEFMNATLV